VAVAAMGALAAGGAFAIAAALPLKGPPATIVQFGYVKSLTKKGAGYELRFDPALWLSGQTANRAAIEDGVIAPGDVVPNDYYIRNPDKKLLTYRIPRNAAVTVLTAGPTSTRISVAELAAIVKGKNPMGRKLFDVGRHLGYWVRIRIDTVLALDQQYQP
jgi:hypothetical protein